MLREAKVDVGKNVGKCVAKNVAKNDAKKVSLTQMKVK